MSSALPLAIDIGATRVRIAHAVRDGSRATIRRIAVRQFPDGAATSGSVAQVAFVAAVIEDARQELGVAERRCVCAIGVPDAFLYTMTLPPMTRLERERAARFELSRFTPYPLNEAVIRIRPIDQARHVYAVGLARAAAVKSRVAAIRTAGLRPVAMDHEAVALARSLPGFDVIVDIGLQRTSVHACRVGGLPQTIQISRGGDLVTAAIARELGVDEESAERRKRIVGTAGAGKSEEQLALEIAAALESFRRHGPVRNAALVGNGARTKGLSAAIASAANLSVSLPVSDALRSESMGDDVLCAAAADWNLVAGIALWSAA
ncbi:MAG: pilus assembly protein PilM [Candidatus Eremiobacteraeota bacterium]|nr:pilus assembly protein PilM [Candidatus Eremiobacteraeota bacterium]